MSDASREILLSARDVRKTYRMGRVDVPVLKGASLEVEAGEWIAVLGASGSGKSTLLHLLGDLDQADPGGGEIRFAGRHVIQNSQRARNRYRNRSIGFVFQFYHLLPELNVLENTLLPALVGLSRLGYYAQRSELRSTARELLESFGLGHRLKHRPRELSGGERQRVAIARALMNKPTVLLADEPTGNLDEETGKGILDLLAEQHASGLTIVMVTHDPDIAARADRVVTLHDGRVVE
ncbi:MAG: ABC transporter ATP-binding protein [Phycisphaerales bacterium]|nr:MAG: ABC transporter ATP-binding protein [Phycisphaerales bacterium]